mgnify:CR=1 FL=1
MGRAVVASWGEWQSDRMVAFVELDDGRVLTFFDDYNPHDAVFVGRPGAPASTWRLLGQGVFATLEAWLEGDGSIPEELPTLSDYLKKLPS